MWDILRSWRKSEKDDSPSAVKLRGAAVNFKDLNLSLDDASDDEESLHHSEASSSSPKQPRQKAMRNKLIIIMVGLPGRGKTFLCNKLKCYLNW